MLTNIMTLEFPPSESWQVAGKARRQVDGRTSSEVQLMETRTDVKGEMEGLVEGQSAYGSESRPALKTQYPSHPNGLAALSPYLQQVSQLAVPERDVPLGLGAQGVDDVPQR